MPAIGSESTCESHAACLYRTYDTFRSPAPGAVPESNSVCLSSKIAHKPRPGG